MQFFKMATDIGPKKFPKPRPGLRWLFRLAMQSSSLSYSFWCCWLIFSLWAVVIIFAQTYMTFWVVRAPAAARRLVSAGGWCRRRSCRPHRRPRRRNWWCFRARRRRAPDTWYAPRVAGCTPRIPRRGLCRKMRLTISMPAPAVTLVSFNFQPSAKPKAFKSNSRTAIHPPRRQPVD